MPTRREIPDDKKDALRSSQLIVDVRKSAATARDDILAYRRAVNAPDAESPNTDSVTEMFQSLGGGNWSALSAAQQLELLRQNQRQILLIINLEAQAMLALARLVIAINAALVKMLRFIRRSGE